jgi:hypothetical protein
MVFGEALQAMQEQGVSRRASWADDYILTSGSPQEPIESPQIEKGPSKRFLFDWRNDADPWLLSSEAGLTDASLADDRKIAELDRA